MPSLTTYDIASVDDAAHVEPPRISYIRELKPASPAKRGLASAWIVVVAFIASRWAVGMGSAKRGTPGARGRGILCFETMGERLSYEAGARASVTERVGSGFVLGAWLAALLACAAAFELAWTPPAREAPLPAAEPTEPEQSSPDPKTPAFDESTEPTPT